MSALYPPPTDVRIQIRGLPGVGWTSWLNEAANAAEKAKNSV